METNKLEDDYKKFQKVKDQSADTQRRIEDAVDAYLQSQATSDRSINDILKEKFREYEDFRNPEFPLSHSSAQRLSDIKRAIYFNEISPKVRKQLEEMKEAA